MATKKATNRPTVNLQKVASEARREAAAEAQRAANAAAAPVDPDEDVIDTSDRGHSDADQALHRRRLRGIPPGVPRNAGALAGR
jgi:hypothetical protein